MPTDQRPLAIFVMGPTASGKTALACALAQRFRVGLISVDSALVYRGLDIGSAKPDAATLAEYPHRLIDIRDPADPYSAAQFRDDALREMQAMLETGLTPLLVGGTGLYFRALQGGLSNLPAADESVRARVAAAASSEGWPALHARLRDLDPAAAQRIRPGDTQRIQRALEVIELTGRPLTEQLGRAPGRFGWRVLKLALVPADRAALHARIAARVDAMISAGLLDEVAALRRRGDLHVDLPAMRAVGYRQAWRHLESRSSVAEFRDRAVFATRQLAKRQMTWLRAELDARVLEPFDPALESSACAALDAFVERPAGGPEAAVASQM